MINKIDIGRIAYTVHKNVPGANGYGFYDSNALYNQLSPKIRKEVESLKIFNCLSFKHRKCDIHFRPIGNNCYLLLHIIDVEDSFVVDRSYVHKNIYILDEETAKTLLSDTMLYAFEDLLRELDSTEDYTQYTQNPIYLFEKLNNKADRYLYSNKLSIDERLYNELKEQYLYNSYCALIDVLCERATSKTSRYIAVFSVDNLLYNFRYSLLTYILSKLPVQLRTQVGFVTDVYQGFEIHDINLTICSQFGYNSLISDKYYGSAVGYKYAYPSEITDKTKKINNIYDAIAIYDELDALKDGKNNEIFSKLNDRNAFFDFILRMNRLREKTATIEDCKFILDKISSEDYYGGNDDSTNAQILKSILNKDQLGFMAHILGKSKEYNKLLNNLNVRANVRGKSAERSDVFSNSNKSHYFANDGVAESNVSSEDNYVYSQDNYTDHKRNVQDRVNKPKRSRRHKDSTATNLKWILTLVEFLACAIAVAVSVYTVIQIETQFLSYIDTIKKGGEYIAFIHFAQVMLVVGVLLGIFVALTVVLLIRNYKLKKNRD